MFLDTCTGIVSLSQEMNPPGIGALSSTDVVTVEMLWRFAKAISSNVDQGDTEAARRFWCVFGFFCMRVSVVAVQGRRAPIGRGEGSVGQARQKREAFIILKQF